MADHLQRQYVLLFLVMFLFCCTYSAHAYQFLVGGRSGWVLNPSESYSHWAERLRFQVNDTLLFRYNNQTDSVLVVNQGDYDSCNSSDPILKLDDGNSVFKFDRSGPFFFITGNKTNCDGGQKLIIVVLAVRNRPPTSPVPVAPSPSSTGQPSLSPSPGLGVPSPAAISPSSPSPTEAPAPSVQGSGPSPAAASPVISAAPSSPSMAPTEAPSPAILGSGPSPAAASPMISTSPLPSSSVPGSPSTPSTGGPVTGNTPAGVNGTSGGSPPRSLAAPACIPSVVLVSTLSLALSFAI